MGSPYLLAHGLGRPVADAVTTVKIPRAGKYRVFVRTKDWVARWNAPGTPGRFQLSINGDPLKETFGTKGANWFWHDGGVVELTAGETTLTLKDLTGFDGRCDAILLTNELDFTPPNDDDELKRWRLAVLDLPAEPEVTGPYDLVVVGGGYSGMGTAISAARMGCKVALIQNRPVLGGNGSSEVRVWAMGNIRRGKFSRIGEIVEEFADSARKSPGTYEEFGDAHKEKVVRGEGNIDLFLNHHANKVAVEGNRIVSVTAFDTRTSRRRQFTGTLFADCTGHGTIGYLAGADHDMEAKGRMGMSNMWAWANADSHKEFPETPWALDLNMRDFPYPRDFHGQWFWESGFDKDPLNDAEGIRDWNLRAVFGAFNAMKNRDGADKHENAFLTWVAYIGGPRESRRLMGDVILSQTDIVNKRDFIDGCVPSTWSIDLHYPKEQYAKKYPDNPFISYAVHDRRVDRQYGYPIPYRCFYSRNIENLFMAGRCISVTHQALGTVRVMKTCGMMGEVAGKAASLCIQYDCDPRDVYDKYLEDLFVLLRLPGKARRSEIGGETTIPDDALPDAGPLGPYTGINPDALEGIVVDDREATKTGKWTSGTGLKGYVGYSYLYASGADKALSFPIKVKATGEYEVRYAYLQHENRSPNALIEVHSAEGTQQQRIDMTKEPPIDRSFISLGKFKFTAGNAGKVVISGAGAKGNLHADAIQVIPVE